MKLTKLLILALGLMVLCSATSFGAGAFSAAVGYREAANSGQTVETQTVILHSLFGNLQDPGVIPFDHSIFYHYSNPISTLEDIRVRMDLPGLDAYSLAGDLTAYNQWAYICPLGLCNDPVNPTNAVAAVRVGLGVVETEYYIVQVRFLQRAGTVFYEGSRISLFGVRVNAAPNGVPQPGATVTCSITNTEGDISIDNSANLVVATLLAPIECNPDSLGYCVPPIVFNVDGQPITNIATLTVREKFTNAWETDSQLRIDISDIPTGFTFIGISDVGVSGSIFIAASSGGCLGNTCTVNITNQTESVLETITVGLQFALTGTPDFAPGDATVKVSMSPEAVPLLPYPISKLKYVYDPVTCYIDFQIIDDVGGKLLSIFNTLYQGMLDTGFAIMNGSGALPLQSPFPQFGSWYMIPEYGTVTFYIYPQKVAVDNNPASPYIYTTMAGSPGIGLDQYGRVPPKGEYTVLLSEIVPLALNAAQQVCPGEQSYFVIIRCNFPSAEGVSYIANWTFDQTAQGYRMVNLTRQEAQDMHWAQPPLPPQ